MVSLPSIDLLYAFHSITFMVTVMAGLSLIRCLLQQKKLEEDLERGHAALEQERELCKSKLKDLIDLGAQMKCSALNSSEPK